MKGIILISTVEMVSNDGVAVISVRRVFREKDAWMVGRELLVPVTLPHIIFRADKGQLACDLCSETMDLEKGDEIVLSAHIDSMLVRPLIEGGKKLFLSAAQVGETHLYRAVLQQLEPEDARPSRRHRQPAPHLASPSRVKNPVSKEFWKPAELGAAFQNGGDKDCGERDRAA